MSKGIRKSNLKKWAQKKYCERFSTVELMASVAETADKIDIAIVSLLEVEPEIRYAGMRADEVHYVKSCHEYLDWLKKEYESGADLPASNSFA